MATTTPGVEAEKLGQEIALLSELRSLVVRAEQLLGDAYRGIVAVEQFGPEAERLTAALTTGKVFATEEEMQGAERLAEAFSHLRSDYAPIELHRAWRAAYELSAVLDDGLSQSIDELRKYDALTELVREQVQLPGSEEGAVPPARKRFSEMTEGELNAILDRTEEDSKAIQAAIRARKEARGDG